MANNPDSLEGRLSNGSLNGGGKKEKWLVRAAKYLPVIGGHIKKIEEQNSRLRTGAVSLIFEEKPYGLTLEDTLNDIIKRIYLHTGCDAVRMFSIANSNGQNKVTKGIGIKRNDKNKEGYSYFEITDYPSNLETRTGRVLPYVIRNKEIIHFKAGVHIGSNLNLIHINKETKEVEKKKVAISKDDEIKIVKNADEIGIYEKLEIPLINKKGEVRYVIVIDNGESRRTMDDVLILNAAGESISLFPFAENAEIAIRDALTGVHNLRYFKEFFLKEVKSTTEHWPRFVSLIMADIDHFKQVNDTYGHDAGDKVLKETAERIVQSCYEIDTIARYGGEEFMIVLPETRAEKAEIAAERIRKSIADSPYQFNGNKLNITISCGVSDIQHATNYIKEIAENSYGKNREQISREEKEMIEFVEARNQFVDAQKKKKLNQEIRDKYFRKLGTLTEAICKTTDMALYRAKAEGRNKVCAYKL